jgi:ABC-2 type transport system ATP-binding protein
VKFAQAIVHDPPLLILDEPTAGLDPDERVAMLHRIRTLSQDAGKAVIISTHILPDVRATCDLVVILAKGEVRVVDTLESLSCPSSPAVQVRTAGDYQPLVERIRASGGRVSVMEDGLLQVEIEGVDATDRIWRWASEAGIGLRSVMPSRNSLEQIFLDAVRGGQRAHS